MVNGREVEEPHSPEFSQAAAIYKSLLASGLRPFRAEVNLFHCGLRVAGQPDLLMRDRSGDVVIVDWKRSKAIRMENDHCHLMHPLEHIPNSNYWLYSLQVRGIPFKGRTYNYHVAAYCNNIRKKSSASLPPG